MDAIQVWFLFHLYQFLPKTCQMMEIMPNLFFFLLIYIHMFGEVSACNKLKLLSFHINFHAFCHLVCLFIKIAKSTYTDQDIYLLQISFDTWVVVMKKVDHLGGLYVHYLYIAYIFYSLCNCKWWKLHNMSR